jgi:hypothetical protein
MGPASAEKVIIFIMDKRIRITINEAEPAFLILIRKTLF